MSSGKLRLFYAVWPDQATRTALQEWQQYVRGRLVVPANLHLTLAFLGAQAPETLPVFKEILASLPGPAFPMSLDRIGSFRRSGIVWAGGEFPAALMDLQTSLTDLLQQKEIAFDKRPYRPHVTLARQGSAAPMVPPLAPIHWRADHIALVQSLTHASGVHYEIVASQWLREESS